ARQRWLAHFEALSDRVLQPTFASRELGVHSLPFYGYDARPPRVCGERQAVKRWDVLHVGHNWWRWREVSNLLLPALEQVRPRIGGVGFLGSWWEAPPAGADELGLEVAFEVDPDRFQRLGIEVRPAVSYTEVIPAMT